MDNHCFNQFKTVLNVLVGELPKAETNDENTFLTNLEKTLRQNAPDPDQLTELVSNLHQDFQKIQRSEFKIRHFVDKGGVPFLTTLLQSCDMNNEALLRQLLEITDDIFFYDMSKTRYGHRQGAGLEQTVHQLFMAKISTNEIKTALQHVMDNSPFPKDKRVVAELMQDMLLSPLINDIIVNRDKPDTDNPWNTLDQFWKTRSPALPSQILRTIFTQNLFARNSVPQFAIPHCCEIMAKLAAASSSEAKNPIPPIFCLHPLIMRFIREHFHETFRYEEEFIDVLIGDLERYTEQHRIDFRCIEDDSQGNIAGPKMTETIIFKVNERDSENEIRKIIIRKLEMSWPVFSHSNTFDRTIETILDLIGLYLDDEDENHTYRSYSFDTRLYTALIDYLVSTPRPSVKACHMLALINDDVRYLWGVGEELRPENMFLKPADVNHPMIIAERLGNVCSSKCCTFHNNLLNMSIGLLFQIAMTPSTPFLTTRYITSAVPNGNGEMPSEYYLNSVFFFEYEPVRQRLFTMDFHHLDRILALLTGSDDGLRRKATNSLKALIAGLLQNNRFWEEDGKSIDILWGEKCQMEKDGLDVSFRVVDPESGVEELIRASKSLLMHCDYFKVLLTGPFEESEQQVIDMKDIPAPVLRTALHLISGCTINMHPQIKQEMCFPLWQVALTSTSGQFKVDLLKAMDFFGCPTHHKALSNYFGRQLYFNVLDPLECLNNGERYCDEIRKIVVLLSFWDTFDHFEKDYGILKDILDSEYGNKFVAALKEIIVEELEKIQYPSVSTESTDENNYNNDSIEGVSFKVS